MFELWYFRPGFSKRLVAEPIDDLDEALERAEEFSTNRNFTVLVVEPRNHDKVLAVFTAGAEVLPKPPITSQTRRLPDFENLAEALAFMQEQRRELGLGSEFEQLRREPD